MIMDENKWVRYIKDRKIIAIDPGGAGGIVVYSVTRDEILEVAPMPDTPLELEAIFRKWKDNAVCYLEKVGGIPGNGAARMFNFGKGVGHLEMCLICKKIPTKEVTPQKWQKEIQCGVKGNKTTTEWKSKLVVKAQQLFPSVGRQFNLTLKKDWYAVADALLILEYARLTEKI